jgi:hypothetical protein
MAGGLGYLNWIRRLHHPSTNTTKEEEKEGGKIEKIEAEVVDDEDSLEEMGRNMGAFSVRLATYVEKETGT